MKTTIRLSDLSKGAAVVKALNDPATACLQRVEATVRARQLGIKDINHKVQDIKKI